jgi:transposase
MMGERQSGQDSLFYSFSLESHVPDDHLLRVIDKFTDLGFVREHLKNYYSHTGRPSIDPELMIRMLLVGYCFGIRSERRLCEEVHLNLAYRWFCRLGLDVPVPDHSTFSKNRHGRFRDSDLLRELFETTVHRCIEEGLVGGDNFAVDASRIDANANRGKGELHNPVLPKAVMNRRAVQEYIATLDDAAFGAASEAPSKYLSPVDPAARWTRTNRSGMAVYSYSVNYLIDCDASVIMDVEGSGAIRQAEVNVTRDMIDRVEETYDIKPKRLAADTAYGSAPMLNWLVEEKDIEPHIPVFDKSARKDGTFARDDFTYDEANDRYVCPAGKDLKRYRVAGRRAKAAGNVPKDGTYRYRALKVDCDACILKSKCCPNTPMRKVPRSIYESSRDVARNLRGTPDYEFMRHERKKVEMSFAHLKAILKLDRLRLRGPCGANDEFLLAATAQNLRKMAKLYINGRKMSTV